MNRRREAYRNIVGTGLVQLTGSIVTALLALGDSLLSTEIRRLTLATLVALATFGGAMALAFNRLRPTVPGARQESTRK